MIICVDFDGTLCEHVFPAIGREAPGAFYWLKNFQRAGAKLILWTMRSDGRLKNGEHREVLTEAVKWCRENGIEFWAVNHNPDQESWTQSPKCYAHKYIDDAAHGCPLMMMKDGDRPVVDWSIVGPQVLNEIRAEKT